jgi:hypothetical protein
MINEKNEKQKKYYLIHKKYYQDYQKKYNNDHKIQCYYCNKKYYSTNYKSHCETNKHKNNYKYFNKILNNLKK